jgi:hypothetical protein
MVPRDGRLRSRIAVGTIAIAAFAACTDGARSPVGPGGTLASAKSGGSTTVSVSATSPSYGSPGETNETVTITGSGFKSGAQAQWLFTDNSSDTTIAVASTRYVSSTQLTSVISISPNSPIAFRNVQVTNADRTKGIGSSVFEVTQAVSISGSSVVRGANDNGEITGNGNGGTAYWSASTGLLTIDASGGTGFTISPMGNAISANNFPALDTRAGPPGTAWVRTNLPVTSAATGGGAQALIADPTSGQVLLIGGRETIPSGRKNSSYDLPDLWMWQSGTSSWLRVGLSTGPSNQGSVRQISQDSIVVGWLGPQSSAGFPSSGSQAAVWQPDGAGGWTLTTIAPVPSGAEGINSTGTIIVGQASGVAVYWQLSGSSWTGPITLPGGCTDARAVDTSGRIAVNGCSASNPEPSAVLVPPYSTSNVVYLGGLGRNNAATVQGMSPSGNWIVGSAGGAAAYWRQN